jgi:hypothetical protein
MRTLAAAVALVTMIGFGGQAEPPLDEAARRAAIEALSTKLIAGYVFPDAAARMVSALREAVARDAYRDITDPRTFADRVTADLRAVAPDKHLAVFFSPQSASTPAPPAGAARERFTFGIARVERLRANVGYLDLRGFSADPGPADHLAAAMTLLSTTDAIIIDLRENGGGSTPGVLGVASYFFDTAVHLTDIHYRDTGETSQFWTVPVAPAKQLTRQDLYILTSAKTFSAAEDFCFALKTRNRATVVGETTAGGAHSGRGLERLSPLFTAFIPVGRSVSPTTGTNWEGVGVAPNLAVPAAQALSEAHVLALRRLLEKETDESWKRNIAQALADVTKK